MAVIINGQSGGGGALGPDTVGTVEIINDSVESADIKDGTIQPADLAFSVPSANRVFTSISSDSTLAGTEDYVIVDTSSNDVTLDLVAVPPSDGYAVQVKWLADGGYQLDVDGNGNSVESGSPFVFDVVGTDFTFTWSSSDSTWLVS